MLQFLLVATLLALPALLGVACFRFFSASGVTARLTALLNSPGTYLVLLAGLTGAGALIALIAPPDIVSSSFLARCLVEAVGHAVPAVEKVGGYSKLPEIAQLQLSVMWALSPLYVSYFFALWMWTAPAESLVTMKTHIATRPLYTLFGVAGGFLFLLGVYHLPEPSWRYQGILDYRYGLVFAATALHLFAFTAFSIALGMLRFTIPLTRAAAFHLGRAYLWALTLGRYRPHMDDRSQPLVSLFGFLVTLVAAIGAVVWLRG